MSERTTSKIQVVHRVTCEHGHYGWHGSPVTDPNDPNCPGGGASEIGMAALLSAFDEAAAEAGVMWNPNLGPILRRAAEIQRPVSDGGSET